MYRAICANSANSHAASGTAPTNAKMGSFKPGAQAADNVEDYNECDGTRYDTDTSLGTRSLLVTTHPNPSRQFLNSGKTTEQCQTSKNMCRPLVLFIYADRACRQAFHQTTAVWAVTQRKTLWHISSTRCAHNSYVH